MGLNRYVNPLKRSRGHGRAEAGGEKKKIDVQMREIPRKILQDLAIYRAAVI